MVLKEVNTLLHVHKVNTSSYHPQTDGLVKWFNSTLQNMLSMYIHDNQKDWDTYLPYVLFTYHYCSLHESTHNTPFFLTYGREPNFPIDVTLGHEGTTEAMSVGEYHGELVGRLVQAQWAAHLTQ